MDKENNRGNLSEMERIHRGLEAFLEKEVYEEYGAGGDAGPEGAAESEKYSDYGESDEGGADIKRRPRQGHGVYDDYGEEEEYDTGDVRGPRQRYGVYGDYGEEEEFDTDDMRRPRQGHGVYDDCDENDESGICGEFGQYGDYDGSSEYNEYEECEVEEPVRAVIMRQHADHSGAGQRLGGTGEPSVQRRGGREQSSQRKESGQRQPSQSKERGKKKSAQREESGKGQSPRGQGGGQSPRGRGGGQSPRGRGGGQSPQSGGRDRKQALPRQESGGEPPVRKKKHRGLRRFLTAAFVLVLALAALWYVTIAHLYDKVEYAPTEILTDQPMKEEGVVNILLIGNDSRAGGGDGRSDAMILVSISSRTRTIYLTSLLRDIYVEIPGHESNRLNAAYAFGGPELLLETIKHNLDIEVNRYVQVNFQAFANLIDAVGGVELELTNEEVQLVNAYLNEYNLLENRPIDTDYLPTDASGLLHLNGPQALAYSRNRYIGSDFGRTERQRKILEAVFHQLPASALTNLDDLIDGILPNLTTNISRSECYTLSLDVPKLLTYELAQASIPIAGSYQSATIRKMAVLQVDFEKNREFIRTQIYGEETGD